jgi:hypothetical protein
MQCGYLKGIMVDSVLLVLLKLESFYFIKKCTKYINYLLIIILKILILELKIKY